MDRRNLWRLWAAACTMCVASCGGGGGASGDSGGGGSALSVSGDRASFQFIGFEGAPPAPQSINFTLQSGSGTYYGSVVTDQPTAFDATFTPTSDTKAIVTLALLDNSAGAHSGNLVFRLCEDTQCAKVAWSQTIPYTVSIFRVDTSGLAIAGYEGAVQPQQTVAISPADTSHLLNVSIDTDVGTWLSASHTADAAIAVVASGAGLSSGSYRGTVAVSFAGQVNGPSVAIPVSFTVGSGIVAAPARSIDLTATSTPTTLASTLPVAFQGTQAPAWHATSDQPWLVLQAAGGSGAGSLPYTIDTTQVAAIGNWSSGVANVRVGATGLTDVTIPITLNKKLPELYMVSASTIIAGRASTVRAFGRGLAQLSSGNPIRIGSTTGSLVTVTSDSEATVSVPVLPVGRASVSIANSANLATARASITAATLSAASYATSVNAGEKRSAFYDPSRNAVYAINLTADALVRFRKVGTNWVTDSRAVPAIGDMAMTPDRGTLYVSSGMSDLLAIDPDTLQVVATYTLPPEFRSSLAPGRFQTHGLAITNNLKMWFAGGGTDFSPLVYFDLLHSTFGIETLPQGFGSNGMLYGASAYPSGDGSRLLVAQSLLSPPLPNYIYTSASDSFSAPTLPLVSQGAAFNEDGSKVIVENVDLYETGNFTSIGHIDPYGTGIVLSTVISPDGQRLYSLTTADINTLVVDHIDIFDTTQLQPGGNLLVRLGQIAVTDKALDCDPSSGANCDFRGAFFIGPLGDTLFWVGNRQLVVMPIPSAMSGIASARQRLQRAEAPKGQLISR